MILKELVQRSRLCAALRIIAEKQEAIASDAAMCCSLLKNMASFPVPVTHNEHD